MKPIQADLLILFITVCWGSSYLFMKIGLEAVSPFNLIALRFGVAFLLAAGLFYRHLLKLNWKTIKFAMLLGLFLFMVFTTLTVGLETTTASNAGFLVSLTVVLVPLLNALLFRKPIGRKLASSIVIAMAGIALLTVELPFRITIGDLLCMATAFFYAMHIIVTGHAARQVNPLQLGILQIGFTALYGLAGVFLFESPALPASTEGWVAILFLSVVCSALGFILQTVAQQYTSPARTGLIFSLEPVCAAIFGYIFMNEVMSMNGYIGAALVLAGVFVSAGIRQEAPEAESQVKAEKLAEGY